MFSIRPLHLPSDLPGLQICNLRFFPWPYRNWEGTYACRKNGLPLWYKATAAFSFFTSVRKLAESEVILRSLFLSLSPFLQFNPSFGVLIKVSSWWKLFFLSHVPFVQRKEPAIFLSVSRLRRWEFPLIDYFLLFLLMIPSFHLA